MTVAVGPGDIYVETLAVFDRTATPGEPLTTPEVATALDSSRRTVYKRLETLVDRGDLRTKKVGSRARVWWRPLAAPPGEGSGNGPDPERTAREADERTSEANAARSRVAASERTSRAVFEEAFDAMLIADDDAVYVDANPAACELFGLERSELLGRTVREFAAEDYDFDRAWREFQTSDSERGVFPLIRADGERRFVEFAATPDVLPGRHLSILRDVTEREERERVLREQRDELRRLDRLNAILRGIDRSISRAETRAEVEQAVCESLVESDQYRCAVAVELTPPRDAVDHAAVAGDDRGLLEAVIDATRGTDADRSPVAAAVDAGEVQVVEGTEAPTDHPWQRLLSERGFRSLAVVPLVHHDAVHGILAVLSEEANAFDGGERDVLAELGGTIGHAITALERERALVDEALVEVRLRSRALATPFVDIDGLGTITLDRTIPLDGAVYEYLRVEETTPVAFDEFCDRLSAGAEIRVLDRTADAGWIEVRTEPPTVATLAARFGGRARTVEIGGGTVDLVVEVPRGSNVRELVSVLRAISPDVEFVGQEGVIRRDVTAAELSERFAAELTERQRTVLELAFYAGYFEWPRHTNGEQLAERLDVHPSTLHSHLRRAERKVLAALFERRPASTATDRRPAST